MTSKRQMPVKGYVLLGAWLKYQKWDLSATTAEEAADAFRLYLKNILHGVALVPYVTPGTIRYVCRTLGIRYKKK